MDPLVLKNLNKAIADRKACVRVTNLSDGRDRLVLEGERVEGDLGTAIDQAMQSGKAFTVEVSGVRFFLNPYLPSVRLVVVGAVHITQALAPIAKIAGFHVEIIDPRTAFATAERFSDVQLTADWPQDVLKRNPLDPYCAVVAVTHDPKIDDDPLCDALDTGCFYVGALGSRKTHAKRLERLSQLRRADRDLARIHAPIGLDIGAVSPQEIAVAILAEVIQAHRLRGRVAT